MFYFTVVFQFQKQGKDVEKVKQRLAEIANYVDKVPTRSITLPPHTNTHTCAHTNTHTNTHTHRSPMKYGLLSIAFVHPAKLEYMST